jgi:hypothetical protein
MQITIDECMGIVDYNELDEYMLDLLVIEG